MNYGMFCKKHNHQYEYFCPYCVLEFKQPIKHKEVSNMDFELSVAHLRAVAGGEMSIAEHKHCCEPGICYACRSDGINTVATHIENYREI